MHELHDGLRSIPNWKIKPIRPGPTGSGGYWLYYHHSIFKVKACDKYDLVNFENFECWSETGVKLDWGWSTWTPAYEHICISTHPFTLPILLVWCIFASLDRYSTAIITTQPLDRDIMDAFHLNTDGKGYIDIRTKIGCFKLHCQLVYLHDNDLTSYGVYDEKSETYTTHHHLYETPDYFFLDICLSPSFSKHSKPSSAQINQSIAKLWQIKWFFMSTRLRAASDHAQRLAPTESGAVYSFGRNGWRNSKWRTCRSHDLAS